MAGQGFVADFRQPRGRGRSIFSMNVPKILDCKNKLALFPKRNVLAEFKDHFDARPPIQPLNKKKFMKLATELKLDLPADLVSSVIEDLENDWSTNYRGGAEWAQDHSQDFLEHEDQIMQQVQKDIDVGRVLGPFSRPPFPNKQCPQQPRVNRIFSVPKNKYNPTDPTRRTIFHFSYPNYFSKNHLTPRNDSEMDYDTFRTILAKIAKLGKRTVMFFADVKSAYKLLNIKPQDWFLQVFRIGDKFYVGLTGMFGDVAAGDNWDRFMRVLLAIFRYLLPEVTWFCYVDNIVGLIPPRPDRRTDWLLSSPRFKRFISLSNELGIPLHDIIEPTLRVENCLGWGIDTAKEIVFIKPERMAHIRTHIKLYAEAKDSAKIFVTQSEFDSLIGIIGFCS